MKKISIIVPIYNSEKTLRRCVESLLNQTYSNVEIILVNDGSKDDSLKICKEYQSQNSNIFVYDKENSGVSDTRNLGIKKATGEYIQFVDSDDYIENNMCETLLQVLEKEDADMVMCSISVIKNEEKISDKLECGVYCDENIARKLLEIYRTNYVNSPCNKLYKKALITSEFPHGISLGEDLLFNLKYLRNCKKIVCISDTLYVYDYVNENSLIHIYREDNFEIATLLYDSVRKYGLENQVAEHEFDPVRKSYINSIFYAVQDLCYYSPLSKREKSKKMQQWIQNKNLIECINSSVQVTKQQKILCVLLKQKNVLGICIFFKMKKMISYIINIVKNK